MARVCTEKEAVVVTDHEVEGKEETGAEARGVG